MTRSIMKFNVEIVNEKIYVYVPEGYEIEEREVTDKFKNKYPDVDWLGDFIFKQNGKKIDRPLDFKYEIRVEKPEEEERGVLVYYDGTYVKEFTWPEHDLREITSGDYVYQRAKLDIADPPCGWR